MSLEKIFKNQNPREKKLFFKLMLVRFIIFIFSLYYIHTQQLLDVFIYLFFLFLINKINDIIFLGLLNQLRAKIAFELKNEETRRKQEILKKKQTLSSEKYFGEDNFSNRN